MLVKRLQAEEGFMHKACLQLFCQKSAASSQLPETRCMSAPYSASARRTAVPGDASIKAH